MAFDWTWALWAFPFTFGLGWLASRLDLRQWRQAGQQTPNAYYRGLSHLLNEQQDQAIDAFIEAVQHDPETVDLHFALGSLFRRRGDFDRAIRVHEHLMSRADLTQTQREKAQYALAQDFLSAGLLDRAELFFNQLLAGPFEEQARVGLLGLAERTQDWPSAQTHAEALELIHPGQYQARLAHYACELADQLHKSIGKSTPNKGVTSVAIATDVDGAIPATQFWEKARHLLPSHPRAYLAEAQYWVSQRDCAKAWHILWQMLKQAPSGLPLALPSLVQLATTETLRVQLQTYLNALPPETLSIDRTLASAALVEPEISLKILQKHLQHDLSLVIAQQWLTQQIQLPPIQAQSTSDSAWQLVDKTLQHAAMPLQRYRCAACGFTARQYFWQCPGCQTWDSYPKQRVEEL